MKTKPLKALEPGFRKKTNSYKGIQIFLFTLYAVSAITFVIGTVISGRQYEKAKAENKQKDATIARQQLIIDTLKGDTTSYSLALITVGNLNNNEGYPVPGEWCPFKSINHIDHE